MPPKGRKRKAKSVDTEVEASEEEETKSKSKKTSKKTSKKDDGVKFHKGMTKDDLNNCGQKELKQYCVDQGFYAQGKKTVLVNRIFEFFQTGEKPKTPKKKTRKKEDTSWMSKGEKRDMEIQKARNAAFFGRGEFD